MIWILDLGVGFKYILYIYKYKTNAVKKLLCSVCSCEQMQPMSIQKYSRVKCRMHFLFFQRTRSVLLLFSS